MTYDVVVVGGGIGGLTVASLLSARGINVCLLERQSLVGGCVSRIQYSQHEFEPGLGFYSGWGEGEIHRKIFAELAVPPPDVTAIDSGLVVRLADGIDVKIFQDDSKFFTELRRSFPECGESAVKFYRDLSLETQSGRDKQTGEGHSLFAKAIRAFRPRVISTLDEKPAMSFAAAASPRFRAFVNVQLRTFTNNALEDIALSAARTALTIPRENRYSINGGPASLSERLAESISKSGGKVRLDSPVLRLAYNDSGRAIGLDLLSGETVLAKHAIVSNLTIWDTYGKLVGLNRTPTDVKTMLSSLSGTGVYLLFASAEEVAVSRLPSPQMLVAPALTHSDDARALTFAAPSATEIVAPAGKRSVTVSTQVEVNDWFTFQSSQEELEEWDQAALEKIWDQLHRALPELGSDIEVIETANPRTFYDTTRRKLGMVLGAGKNATTSHTTCLPNLFVVGDTVSTAPTIASVSQCALELADKLTALVNR